MPCSIAPVPFWFHLTRPVLSTCHRQCRIPVFYLFLTLLALRFAGPDNVIWYDMTWVALLRRSWVWHENQSYILVNCTDILIQLRYPVNFLGSSLSLLQKSLHLAGDHKTVRKNSVNIHNPPTIQCNQSLNVPELCWNTITVIVFKPNISLFLCKWGLF